MGSKNGKPVLTDENAAALAQSSGLDVVQVREHFDAFVAEHPNGKMKKKDFREMMAKALPKKDAGKMEKHVFRIYDTNDDGYIDFVEFMVVYYIMSDGSPEEVLDKIFRVFDVNSDGTITKKELTRLIKDMYGLLNSENPEELTRLIKDMYGLLNSENPEELTRLIKDMYGLLNSENPEELSKDLIAKSAFAEMDKDEDGKITKDEFVGACLGQEQFSKMLALKIIDIFVEDGDE